MQDSILSMNQRTPFRHFLSVLGNMHSLLQKEHKNKHEYHNASGLAYEYIFLTLE
jgi:hypothetical protein